MSELTIIKGQEFKLFMRESVSKDDIFFNEYKKAAEILDEIIGAQKEDKNPELEWKNSEFENNIIAFCGERGEGKSSAMITFVNALYNYKKECEIFSSCVNLEKVYFNEPILIDPTLFDDVHNVLDIVLAKIFQRFQEVYRKDNQVIKEYERDRLLDQFQKVYKHISLINNQVKMLDDEFDYEGNISKLAKLGESTNLKKELRDLIRDYLSFMEIHNGGEKKSQSQLIIAIDDLDLCSSNAYKMAEQIRKYLIIPEVTIVMAVKVEQLELCVEEKNLKEFERIISFDKEQVRQINYEVQNMAERYVTKLVPKARRIYLPKAQALDNIQITYKNGIDGTVIWHSDKYDYLVLAVLDLIYKKTGMKFLAQKEDFSFILPNNLRDVVSWIVLLMNMENPESDEIYLENIEIFERHFIKDGLTKQVSMDVGTELKNMKDMDVFHTHVNAKWLLNNKYKKSEKKFDFKYPPYQVEKKDSFFEVILWFEAYEKSVFDVKLEQCAYALRVFYTIKINRMLREKQFIKISEFINGYIWGIRFMDVIPGTKGSQVDRSRFNLDTRLAFNNILNYVFESGEKKLEPESRNVSYIPKQDRKEYIKCWMLLGMFSNLYEEKKYPPMFVSTGKLVSGNSNLCKNIQISLENYIVSLCNIKAIYDKVNMGMLGIEREEFNVVAQKFENSNKESIECARNIIAHMDVTVKIKDYCIKNKDYKNKTEGDQDRSSKLVGNFFDNIGKFMNVNGIETNSEALKKVYFDNDEEAIDVCELYARLIELCALNMQENSDNADKRSELVLDFRKKITDKPEHWNEQFYSVAGHLRKATAENAKKRLDTLASNIQRYMGRTKSIPSGLDVEFLCDLYSKVIEVYLQDKKKILSDELKIAYREAAKLQNILNK